MTSFKIALHIVTNKKIVEVFDDQGNFVAVIYPLEDGIHVVSSHLDGPPQNTATDLKDDYTLYGVHTIPGFMFKFRKE
jgi:hypothetical protein